MPDSTSNTPASPDNSGRFNFENLSLQVNGIEFALLGCGPKDGELALCLHGFPDSAWTWRYLLPSLAEAGYRAVAPFQRGYAPTGVDPLSRYQTGALASDACGISEELSPGRAGVLIGHDWGAFAAYGASAYEPQRWRKVVTAAVPPVAALANAFFSYDQLRRSWYMFFFQSPLAETAVGMNDLDFIARLWADWSPGYDGIEDVAWVKQCLSQPENLEAAIGYYRAMFDPTKQVPEFSAQQAASMAPTTQPLLYIHGQDDGCLSVDLAREAEGSLNDKSEMYIVKGAGHFMNVEKPDEVNSKILDFIGPPQN
ncbi:MAG TPA: alpha/beta hydrolase [Acidimicrobiales bacterium]|nr:alpha/beta hydrolase [Acidimicrobiales bacterium]